MLTIRHSGLDQAFVHRKQCIFIIGAMRSGNTWLYRMLCEHPQVFSVEGEVRLFSDYVSALNNAWMKDKKIHEITPERTDGISHRIDEDVFSRLVAQFIDGFYKELDDDDAAKSHYIEKKPGNARCVDVIKKFCPNARFIHMIRDGRNVAISAMSAYERYGWGVKSISDGARHWHHLITQSKRAQALWPNDYMEVRYEQLVLTPEDELARILDFCGLGMTPQNICEIVARNSFAKRPVSAPTPGILRADNAPHEAWNARMSLTDRYHFDRIAGRLLIDLGYADENWWRNGAFAGHAIDIQWRARARMASYGMRLARLGTS